MNNLGIKQTVSLTPTSKQQSVERSKILGEPFFLSGCDWSIYSILQADSSVHLNADFFG